MRGLAVAGALIVAASLAGVAHAVQPSTAVRLIGARPVTMRLTVASFPLVCGRPEGTLVVALPAVVGVPHAITQSAVAVNGRRSSTIAVVARRVSIVPAHSSGVTCMSIVDAPLKIVFARRAGMRSSAPPGRYAATLRRGTQTYRATLDIAG